MILSANGFGQLYLAQCYQNTKFLLVICKVILWEHLDVTSMAMELFVY